MRRPGTARAVSPEPITRPKLLVVEGQDARHFLGALLGHLGLGGDIQITDAGGIDEWTVRLQGIRGATGFDQLQSLGLIRDAEAGSASAVQSVCAVLRRAGLPVPAAPFQAVDGPPRVGVFILPDCASAGMLETLCVQAVAADAAMPCVDAFIGCLQDRLADPPANLDKARVRAFLASRLRSHLLLGQAARAGYIPWDSPAFHPLKQFLRNL
ncbi:MAG: hypothetical protein HY321_21250 [Armatimonadetes bacterium]|nr:hypothetical protein [Armatimonadota bacterium]